VNNMPLWFLKWLREEKIEQEQEQEQEDGESE